MNAMSMMRMIPRSTRSMISGAASPRRLLPRPFQNHVVDRAHLFQLSLRHGFLLSRDLNSLPPPRAGTSPDRDEVVTTTAKGVCTPPFLASARPCRPCAAREDAAVHDGRPPPGVGARPHRRTPVARPAGRASIRRPRLVAQLTGPGSLVLVAPAGFGKTQAAVRVGRPRPAAVRVGDAAGRATTIRRRCCDRCRWPSTARRADVVRRPHRAGPRRRPRPAPCRGARRRSRRSSTSCPPRSSVALASRAEPPVPLARLRAEGLVTELRHGDLAMTRGEAAALLRGAGLQARPRRGRRAGAHHRGLAGGAVARRALARRPARPGPGRGALRRRRPARRGVPARRGPGRAGRRTSGGSSQQHRDPRRAHRAAVRRGARALGLGRHARPGCCAPASRWWRSTARASASATIACSTDLLRADLSRARSRARGAAAPARQRLARPAPETAERGLQHALAADEVERAGDLVWSGVPRSVEQGSSATVEHWLSQFTDAQIAAHPRLALAAAGTQLDPGPRRPRRALAGRGGGVRGRPGDRRRRRRAARRARARRARADGPGRRARLRAAGARRVPCQALCELLRGVAEHLRGDADAARAAARGGRAAGRRARPARPRPVPRPSSR